MKRKMLIAVGCSLAAVLILSTLGSLIPSTRSQVSTEPESLSQLVKYPGEVRALHDLTAEEIQTEIMSLEFTGMIRGILVEGAFDVRQKLIDKGYIHSFFDATFDVFTDVEVHSPDGTESISATFFKGWSNTMLEEGSKAMVVGAVGEFLPTGEQFSIIMSVPTNVLPPEQMPDVDPFIIWNAEPYFYVQHYWWVWSPWARLVYWKYWWYDSHKAPNWFWGVYWWWRVYVIDYFYSYRWWYWWWWNWYYWRGWYWWSTYWVY